jgi:phosphoribosylanthranilate isomerase
VTRVKICGVKSIEQALACAEAGADALGINFVASSPRRIDADMARAIVRAVGDRTLVVGVVEGMTVDAMRALRDGTGVGCLQVHGEAPGASVAALLPHAYAAVGVSSTEDALRAGSMPGEFVMVDAKIDGRLGGTGQTFDWSLVVELAKKRKLVLAGGLTPANVAAAIRAVRPWCVDVASGVEKAPGDKDLEKVRAFIEAARDAARDHLPG